MRVGGGVRRRRSQTSKESEEESDLEDQEDADEGEDEDDQAEDWACDKETCCSSNDISALGTGHVD